jgi:hypothetical protein
MGPIAQLLRGQIRARLCSVLIASGVFQIRFSVWWVRASGELDLDLVAQRPQASVKGVPHEVVRAVLRQGLARLPDGRQGQTLGEQGRRQIVDHSG